MAIAGTRAKGPKSLWVFRVNGTSFSGVNKINLLKANGGEFYLPAAFRYLSAKADFRFRFNLG